MSSNFVICKSTSFIRFTLKLCIFIKKNLFNSDIFFWLVQNENVESKSNSSCEDLHSFQSRGRPDGGEMDEVSPSPPTSVPVLSSFTSSKVKDLKSAWDKPPIAAKPEMRRESNQFFTDARHETNSQNEGERESVPTGSESRRESTSSTSGLKIPSNGTGEKGGSGKNGGPGDRKGSDQFLTRNDSSRYDCLFYINF